MRLIRYRQHISFVDELVFQSLPYLLQNKINLDTFHAHRNLQEEEVGDFIFLAHKGQRELWAIAVRGRCLDFDDPTLLERNCSNFLYFGDF